MRERYKTASAVMLLLLRERNGRQEILLQKRRNTGYADGMWDCGAAGHVEAVSYTHLTLPTNSRV